MQRLKVLVTGSSGALGRQIVKQSVSKGHNVVLLNRLLSDFRLELYDTPKVQKSFLIYKQPLSSPISILIH